MFRETEKFGLFEVLFPPFALRFPLRLDNPSLKQEQRYMGQPKRTGFSQITTFRLYAGFHGANTQRVRDGLAGCVKSVEDDGALSRT